MLVNDIREKLSSSGLRVTPQRVAVMEAIMTLHDHPTTEAIIQFIKEHHPHVVTGTVYKILDILVENGLVRRVKTDNDVMRYDAILDKHHHLYCAESDRIEDYFDEELNRMLEEYFDKHRISGFKIEDIKLQIIGKFKKQKRTIQ
jgi:Fur family peroxide stress response transcriptional regulator